MNTVCIQPYIEYEIGLGLAFTNNSQWLRIDEHTNFGVAVENIANEVMVKPLCPVFDVSGPIDFLGYMF